MLFFKYFFKPKWNRPSDYDGMTIWLLLLIVMIFAVLGLAFIQDVFLASAP